MNHKINKNYQEIKIKTQKWAEEKGLIFKGEGKKAFSSTLPFSLLASLTNPNFSSENLLWVSKFVFWVFVMDDIVDGDLPEETQRLEREIFNVIEEKEWNKFNDESDNLFYAWEEINNQWKMISKNEEMQKRMIYYWEKYYEFSSRLNKIRSEKKLPSEKEYLDIRVVDGGAYQLFIIGELELKDFSYDESNQEIKRLTDIAALNVAGINDIFSLKKDKSSNELINWIFIVQKQYSLNEEEAINYCKEYLKKEMIEFKNISEKITDPSEISYVEMLKDWMFGHSEWYKYCKRYNENALEKVEELINQIEQPPK